MTLRLAQLLVATALFAVLAAPALAGPPAAIPEAGQERAGRAFEAFANEWMAKMERAERHNRSQPRVEMVGGQRLHTYRAYPAEFDTELKPTGHSAAPYVGVLRYRETLYRCTDAAAKNCRAASSTPVTEIFRFQNGRWVY